MEASAIKQHLRVGGGVRNRTPLLRMQSDERLVTLVRRGNQAAFGALVSRYEARLLAFCRHLLRSREDAEDVLQEVFASAFKAMMADERPIRVRPWLYRIARNRCLNHLRRISAIGVDSIEDHFSEHGPSTSDMAQRREDLWQLVGDIQELPESQRSALLLREMEALSYEQIAEVLDKTIPSVKSLLIRARRSLAESAEARSLSCEEARLELQQVNAGLRERPSRVVRRHIAACQRCSELREPERSLAAIRVWLPLAPVLMLKKLPFSPLFHSARAGSTATAAGASAAAGPSLLGGTAAAGLVSAGVGGLAGKAAVGLTAAALGVAGAVVVDTSATKTAHPSPRSAYSTGAIVAAASPVPYAAAVDLAPRLGRPHAGPNKPRTSPPVPTAERTTTTATAPVRAVAKARARTKAGRSGSQAMVIALTGPKTHLSDATDAAADPAVLPGSISPSGSGGAAATGTAPSSVTTPGATTPPNPTTPPSTTTTPPAETGAGTTPVTAPAPSPTGATPTPPGPAHTTTSTTGTSTPPPTPAGAASTGATLPA